MILKGVRFRLILSYSQSVEELGDATVSLTSYQNGNQNQNQNQKPLTATQQRLAARTLEKKRKKVNEEYSEFAQQHWGEALEVFTTVVGNRDEQQQQQLGPYGGFLVLPEICRYASVLTSKTDVADWESLERERLRNADTRVLESLLEEIKERNEGLFRFWVELNQERCELSVAILN